MLENIKNNLVLLFWIIFSFAILFFLTESLYNQKKVDDYLIEFENQNKKISEKNLLQQQDLSFFESDFYKEIYAKENLNLLNKWEKIIIIEEWFLENNFFLKSYLTEKFEDEKFFTNFQKWEKYFNLN